MYYPVVREDMVYIPTRETVRSIENIARMNKRNPFIFGITSSRHGQCQKVNINRDAKGGLGFIHLVYIVWK